jgi:glycosyltransferase involved in cell wall biosynthesis
MSSKSGIFYSFLKKIDLAIINNLINKVDSFVFCTDLMAAHFKVGSRPWIRIEGMYDSQSTNGTKTEKNPHEKILLYTGTLDSRYGILDLIEAFKLMTDPEYRLWICGDGNMKNHILEYATKDSRVKYFGQVSRAEALNLQQNATALINPRTSLGDYTKYSFPIKTMEYLASGKPCIMHRLPGIPEEYLSHLFIPDCETPSGLSKKIEEVCTMDKFFLKEHCQASKSFILKEKNPINQISKLASMLND